MSGGDIELYEPEGIYRPAGYAQAARAGDFVFVAGQIGKDASGELVSPGEAGPQARLALANLKAALEAAGAALTDVVKLTTILVDRADGPAVTQIRREFFGAHRPPHTGLIIAGLGTAEAKVEFEAVAYRPSR